MSGKYLAVSGTIFGIVAVFQAGRALTTPIDHRDHVRRVGSRCGLIGRAARLGDRMQRRLLTLIVVLTLPSMGGCHRHHAAANVVADACPVGISCDDGNACTHDFCTPGVGCTHIDVARCNVPHATTVLPLPSGSFCTASSCPIPASDGDGLNDAWKAQGGIDINCDGIVDSTNDVLLPGAVTGEKDVYLAYDYMEQTGAGAHSHAPSAAAVQAVVDAFQRQGVVLHVDPVHHALPHHAVVTFDPVVASCAGPDAVNFYDLKAAFFDPKRLNAYHYVIFGHYNTCDSGADCSLCVPSQSFGGGGRSELPGNDIIVSTGVFFDAGLTPPIESEAGLLMHELGHNLGLRHGGDADMPVFKPNYLSVVNDNFTYVGIAFSAASMSTTAKACSVSDDCTPAGICTSAGTCARIDYSDQLLPSLNELSLDESVGIQAASTDITTYVCPSPSFTPSPGAGTGPIDWNCTPPNNETGVVADINGDGSPPASKSPTTLTGFRDWTAVNYEFQCTARGSADAPPPAAGAGTSAPQDAGPSESPYSVEPSVDAVRERHRLFAPRNVRVEFRPGVLAEFTLVVFGAPGFDVGAIDRDSLRLAGARPIRIDAADFDGDGYPDLLVSFAARANQGNRKSVTLSGWLSNSQLFSGDAALWNLDATR